MLELNDLVISPATLGNKLELNEVNPCFVYDKANKRWLDQIEGYRYELCMRDKRAHGVSVKILGQKRMEQPPEGSDGIPVELEGVEFKVYVIKGNARISVTATGIHPVKSN